LPGRVGTGTVRGVTTFVDCGECAASGGRCYGHGTESCHCCHGEGLLQLSGQALRDRQREEAAAERAALEAAANRHRPVFAAA
jgi:hypothetical protein